MLRAVGTAFRIFSNANAFVKTTSRSFSTSHAVYLKEIRETQENDTLIIEGVAVKPKKDEKIVNTSNNHGSCPLCALGLDVKHTDILIIKQFLDHNAKLYPRRITGLCRQQQRKMQYLVEMATRAGLINPLITNQPIPEYQRGWRRFNSYYDESEIPPSKTEKAIQRQREFEEAAQIAIAEREAHEVMLKKKREERRLLQR